MSELWDFSLSLYRRAGVEPLCLQLQDRWRADVTLLLWLRWLEEEGVSVDEDRLTEALWTSAAWRERVVEPLRALRRAIKRDYGTGPGTRPRADIEPRGDSPHGDDTLAEVEACRQSIKRAELQAERVALQKLAELARPWLRKARPGQVTPGSNLRGYAHRLSLPESTTRELVERLS